MKHIPNALICGGGIAGPAAVLFLRHAGIESQIFEAYPEPSTTGGGFQIAPNGMRVMETLGLADQVRASGVLSSDFVFRNQHGKVIGRIDVSSAGQGVTIRRSEFHRILMDAVARAGIPIHYGKRLLNIKQSGNAVAAQFEGGHVETGDLLLAADGVHSRVRALILPGNASARYTGFLGIGGFAEAQSACPTDSNDARQLNFTVGSRFQIGYAKMSESPTRWGWWTHLPEDQELTRAELQAITDDKIRDRVLAAFGCWHSPIRSLVSNTRQIMRTAIYDVPALPSWHVGRVMLVGDAAHAMSPAGGQGASLALEDAMLLGKALASGSRSITETFALVEVQLRTRAERMVRRAAQNDLRQLKELGRFGQWIRDQAFSLVAAVIARELRHQYTALQHLESAA
jgi:2-polyprenyl-6-methoxyphenol hydroxylase-like FAD-dependent oxidoreductase